MIGVILWSDPTDQKAVIWCEDHGDLAYLSRADAVSLPDSFVDVGDLVEFNVVTERNLRMVKSVNLVAAAKGAALADQMRARTQTNATVSTAHTTAEIIPFRPELAVQHRRSASDRVQRQG